MVSYHAPKVYRSPFGCCICKAKSSSSRFTDSDRYEREFVACFQLSEPRYGEICNACVLLIKRWKKLPIGTKRHWHHVVDARARPRGKAAAIRTDCSIASTSDAVTAAVAAPDRSVNRIRPIRKHRYLRKIIRERSPMDLSDDQGIGDDRMSEASMNSVPSSRAPSPSPYPSEDDSELIKTEPPSLSKLSLKGGVARRKQKSPSKPKYGEHGEFVDLSYWKKEKVCCGLVFRGVGGEVLIDPRFFKPCCPINLSDSPSSPGSSTATNLSFSMSDRGSNYEDEGLESLDEEPENEYLFSRSTRSEDTSLLTQLAAALVS